MGASPGEFWLPRAAIAPIHHGGLGLLTLATVLTRGQSCQCRLRPAHGGGRRRRLVRGAGDDRRHRGCHRPCGGRRCPRTGWIATSRGVRVLDRRVGWPCRMDWPRALHLGRRRTARTHRMGIQLAALLRDRVPELAWRARWWRRGRGRPTGRWWT